MPILADENPARPGHLAAAYLRFVSQSDDEIRGALFTINSRAEPLEFVFNSVSVPAHFLWRAGEARRAAIRTLAQSLFQASARTPDLILSLADEVPPRVFTEDLTVKVPLCRVAEASTIQSAGEVAEMLAENVHLFWATAVPEPDSDARLLLESLSSADLLMEPFERTAFGIEEAFAEL